MTELEVNFTNLGSYYVPSDTKDGICIDIGANVGCFFESHNDHFSLIHYYEPVDQNWKICSSKVFENVVGYKEVASYNDDETIELVAHENNHSGSCRVINDHPHWSKNVVASATSCSFDRAVTRILEQSNREFIDYMKLDCECCEYDFLMNNDLSKIKYIGMELHNQLGKEKSSELYDWISRTHNPSTEFGWFPDPNGRHLDILWTPKGDIE